MGLVFTTWAHYGISVYCLVPRSSDLGTVILRGLLPSPITQKFPRQASSYTLWSCLYILVVVVECYCWHFRCWCWLIMVVMNIYDDAVIIVICCLSLVLVKMVALVIWVIDIDGYDSDFVTMMVVAFFFVPLRILRSLFPLFSFFSSYVAIDFFCLLSDVFVAVVIQLTWLYGQLQSFGGCRFGAWPCCEDNYPCFFCFCCSRFRLYLRHA